MELSVFHGSIRDYVAEKKVVKSFGVITSWDVFKRVESPAEFLLQIRTILAPKGIFIFSTIFIDSLVSRLLGRRWPWILPMHVSYFDTKFLSTISFRFRISNLELIPNHIQNIGY